MSLLSDYNVQIVLFGTLLLGLTAGLVGSFLLLRKRPLLGDVTGHATLPGIALAFLIAEAVQAGSGKATLPLLTGAAAGGLLGAVTATALSLIRKVGPDTAQAAVLGLFFGVGAALIRIVQQAPGGGAAGLSGYFYGKAASLQADDVLFFSLTAGLVLAVTLGFYKELMLICFDPDFAAASGLPTHRLDGLLTVLTVLVTVLGLQSVGLVLVVATLTVPPASARFWTDGAKMTTWLSGLFGGVAAVLGVLVSAAVPRLAAGATIVLAGSALFLVSLVFGPKGGLIALAAGRRTAPAAKQ